MAAITPSTSFLPRTIHLGLTYRDRRTIEAQIEALIEILDTLDGDPDLEDDELHDDPLDLGEPQMFMATLPKYGVDQTQGPTNERSALEEHQRSLAA